MYQDVDYKIIELLLSTNILPKECRNNPTFHECINELSMLHTSRLSTESSYLRECHRKVVEENYNLAFDNYSTFIQTAECTKDIFKDFVDVEQENASLLEGIPIFQKKCEDFLDKMKKSSSLTKMNSLTLNKHNQILEVLEVPQLLEACIRNGYVDEALGVLSHTRKLERRHHSNVKVIADVAKECCSTGQKLLEQLFSQLSGPLQLPTCLKIVGYLRRIECLPESLLRLKFLQCRDTYLNNSLRSAIAISSDPFFRATKYLEVTRIHLFDVATQYRAVFSDDVISTMDDVSTSVPGTMSDSNGLLGSWMARRVRLLLSQLTQDLAQLVEDAAAISISSSQQMVLVGHSRTTKSTSGNSGTGGARGQSTGSKLQSLLGQSMYFGLSLARLGADFRALLLPLFYQPVLQLCRLRLDWLVEQLTLQIARSTEQRTKYNFINQQQQLQKQDQKIPKTLTDIIRGLKSVASVRDDINNSQEELLCPQQLMRCPLLAAVLNHILITLEELRLCTPKLMQSVIVKQTQHCLETIAKECVNYFSMETTKIDDNQIDTTLLFMGSLVPHVDLSLRIIFDVQDCTWLLDVESIANIMRPFLLNCFFDDMETENESSNTENVKVVQEGLMEITE